MARKVVEIPLRSLLIGGAVVVLVIGILATTTYPRWIGRLAFRGLITRLPVGQWFLAEKIKNRRGLDLNTEDGKMPVLSSYDQDAQLRSIGESFTRLFYAEDMNEDDYLNPFEFKAVLDKLKPIKFGPFSQIAYQDSSPNVTLFSNFLPLKLETMTKIADPISGSSVAYLDGLIKWKAAHKTSIEVAMDDVVETFYPMNARSLPVGEAYVIVTADNDIMHRDIINPSSLNRYYPPLYTNRAEKTLSHILSIFHKRAFTFTRFPPCSSAAVVRAVSDHFVEIHFRLHGEFQLNLPPNYPFWFTPSFFLGHVIVSKNLSQVVEMQMSIPRERKLNVDMEWLTASLSGDPLDTRIEVDIGYIPEMSVFTKTKPSNIQWQQEISKEEAFNKLEVLLYPFKKVPYSPFVSAFNQAAAEEKLVHSVVLWGSLDDQSC